MQPTFSDVLTPLFKYLGSQPSVTGHEEAFELMMRSGLTIALQDYPAGNLTMSCNLPFAVEEERVQAMLLELLQVNIMNLLSPPIIIAATGAGDEIVLWARLPWEGMTADQLINLYERFAHYAETVNKRLTTPAQIPEPQTDASRQTADAQ
jgi:hypothetical protein